MNHRSVLQARASYLHVQEVFVLMFSLLLLPVTSFGQTRFSEPTEVVDYTSYSTPDQCSAALERISGHLRDRDETNWDTVSPGITWRRTPWPASLISTMQVCSRRWSAASASPDEFRWLFPVYLAADRTADAHRYLARTLDSAINKGTKSLVTVFLTATSQLIQARPSRLREADSLLNILGASPPGMQRGLGFISMNWVLRRAASEIGDTIMAMRVALRAETAWVELQSDAKQGLSYAIMQGEAIQNNQFIHRRMRMDSLRSSTAAYVTLVQHQTRRVVQNGAVSAIGDARPALTADFWFPHQPTPSHPTPGAISLAWPVTGTCAQGGGVDVDMERCQAVYALIRRLHKRFPHLEITLVAYIENGFLSQAPSSASRQAELKWQWLSSVLPIPFTLAVLPGTSIQLPNPDGRIVDTYWTQETLNVYTSGRNAKRAGVNQRMEGTDLGGIQILDQSGTVVWTGWADVEGEMQIHDIIEVLQQRKP